MKVKDEEIADMQEKVRSMQNPVKDILRVEVELRNRRSLRKR